MQFIKTDSLKIGMRLARPIYNKNGVMLYERNSKLTAQGINSIRNFGLIGIYVLEPAEPVPPMTRDDLEFERFQTINSFFIKEELAKMSTSGKAGKIGDLADRIIHSYGRLDHKIVFIQNLRSLEDFTYLHSLNVAILCAMISHNLNMKLDEQRDTVIAALVHDVGKLSVPKTISRKSVLTDGDKNIIKDHEIAGFDQIGNAFSSRPFVKRICAQAERITREHFDEKQSDIKIILGTKVLIVAELFDTLTAMQVDMEPRSEVAVIKYLLSNPEIYDHRVVDALIQSLLILGEGTSVELNTGEKALVIKANDDNVLKPVILCFRTNMIVDLNNEFAYRDIEITDIMKTLDNRYIMDVETLKSYGIKVQDFIPVPEEEE